MATHYTQTSTPVAANEAAAHWPAVIRWCLIFFYRPYLSFHSKHPRLVNLVVYSKMAAAIRQHAPDDRDSQPGVACPGGGALKAVAHFLGCRSNKALETSL